MFIVLNIHEFSKPRNIIIYNIFQGRVHIKLKAHHYSFLVGACLVRRKENCYCGHGNLRTTVKDAFEIANESVIVLQLYDEEWMIYLDIANTDTFSEIKDRAKLQVVLKNNVSFFRNTCFSKCVVL